MKRNKHIVLLAHCLLNVNAKVDGIATESAGCLALVSKLLSEGYGIIQLPCVEQSCCGINRWGQVKEQLNFPAFRKRCRELLQPVVEQAADFAANGYKVAAVIGLDGSPACGVDFTCSGKWGGELGQGFGTEDKLASLCKLNEPGVMMEILADMLDKEGLKIRFLSVDESAPDNAVEELFLKLQK